MEHFCEIILKLGYWPRRICCLKFFLLCFFPVLALVAILFSGVED